jgi:hypothetical protein
MSDGQLPLDLLINAMIRTAASSGVPIIVRRRGDASNGTIVLKINRLDGTARVLTQVRYNDELVWCPVSNKDPMSETEADRYLERQADIDPDSWLLEIEDKRGRHWFPGDIMVL